MRGSLDEPVGELAAVEGIIAAIGPGCRYKDLADFWENVEQARGMCCTTAYEGVPFEDLDKILPTLEARLGVKLKTHIGRVCGPAQQQTRPKT